MEKLLAKVKQIAMADGHDCVIVEEGNGVWRVAITTADELGDGGRANNFADINEKDFAKVKDLKAAAADIYRQVLS